MHLWPGRGQATHFPPLVTGISFRSLAQTTSQGQEARTLLAAGKGRAPPSPPVSPAGQVTLGARGQRHWRVSESPLGEMAKFPRHFLLKSIQTQGPRQNQVCDCLLQTPLHH